MVFHLQVQLIEDFHTKILYIRFELHEIMCTSSLRERGRVRPKYDQRSQAVGGGFGQISDTLLLNGALGTNLDQSMMINYPKTKFVRLTVLPHPTSKVFYRATFTF
jgi:hypothetical protein